LQGMEEKSSQSSFQVQLLIHLRQ